MCTGLGILYVCVFYVCVRACACILAFLGRLYFAATVPHNGDVNLQVNGTASVLINIADHLLDLLLLWLKSKRPHGDLELLGVNGARSIRIEEVECFTDLLLLLFCELIALALAFSCLASAHVDVMLR